MIRTQYKFKSLFNKQKDGSKICVRVRYNPERDTIGYETIWSDPTTMHFKPTNQRIKTPYIGYGMHHHHTKYNESDPFDGVTIMSNSDHGKTHYQERNIDSKGRFE